MESLSSWIFTICVATFVCGVVWVIIPSQTYQKPMQLLLGLFMLYCILTPFTTEFTLPTIDIQAVEDRRIEISDNVTAAVEQEQFYKIENEVDDIIINVISSYNIDNSQVYWELLWQDEYVECYIVLPDDYEQDVDGIYSQLAGELDIPIIIELYRQEG